MKLQTTHSRHTAGHTALLATALLTITYAAGCGGSKPVAPDETHPRQAGAANAVRITTRLPGATAEEMEHAVTVPIERAAYRLDAVQNIRSRSTAELSVVVATFNTVDAAAAGLQAIRARLAQIADDLPANAEAPVAEAYQSANQPAVTVHLSGQLSQAALLRLSEALGASLESESERILRVDSTASSPQITIELAADHLKMYALTLAKVADAIRSLAKATPKSLAKSVIVKLPDGQVLYLSDIATIRTTMPDNVRVLVDGRPGVSLDVFAQSGVGTEAVMHAVRGAIDEHKAEAPEALRYHVHDNSPPAAGESFGIAVRAECGDTPVEFAHEQADKLTRLLRDVEGVRIMRTESRPGQIAVELIFPAGTESDPAVREVRGAAATIEKHMPAVGNVTVEPIPAIPAGRIDVTGSESLDALQAAATSLREQLPGVAGVARVVAPSLAPARSELSFGLTPAARALGLTHARVATAVRDALSGRTVSAGKTPVALRISPAKADMAELDAVLIATKDGKEVPLIEMVRIQRVRGAAAICRTDGHRCVTMELFADGLRQVDAIGRDVKILAAEAEKEAPAGIEIRFSEENTLAELLPGSGV